MSARKLPDIAPCPCGKKHAVAREGLDVHWVVCACGWTGPLRNSERAAILAWNHRRSDDAAERRGAMAAVKWLQRRCSEPYTTIPVFPDIALRKAIDSGEVLPKAQSPEPWIVSKPGVMGGKPCVRGTRVTVKTLQECCSIMSEQDVLAEFPGVPPEGLAAALAYRLPKAQKRGRRG